MQNTVMDGSLQRSSWFKWRRGPFFGILMATGLAAVVGCNGSPGGGSSGSGYSGGGHVVRTDPTPPPTAANHTGPFVRANPYNDPGHRDWQATKNESFRKSFGNPYANP